MNVRRLYCLGTGLVSQSNRFYLTCSNIGPGLCCSLVWGYQKSAYAGSKNQVIVLACVRVRTKTQLPGVLWLVSESNRFCLSCSNTGPGHEYTTTCSVVIILNTIFMYTFYRLYLFILFTRDFYRHYNNCLQKIVKSTSRVKHFHIWIRYDYEQKTLYSSSSNTNYIINSQPQATCLNRVGICVHFVMDVYYRYGYSSSSDYK